MPRAAGLPGVDDPVQDRVILHVDNDCFYAACERIREPELRGKPVVVGMGFEPGDDGGAVATASYEAREYGVESAQPISEAMERLPPRRNHESVDGPTGYYRPVDMEYYEEQAAAVKSILRTHADRFREVSIDEAYLDCTSRTSWDEAESFAAEIQETIAADVGLPVSIGVAPSMSVAKIASDHDKPDGLVVVPPGRVKSFLSPLPIEDLHGIGPVTAETLNEMGVETIGDLAAVDPERIVDQFGDRGRELHQRARGIDPRHVTPRGDPKSLSRESAFGDPVEDLEEVEARIIDLAESVAERATNRDATYRTIGIKVVTPPFEIHTRERSLPGPVDDPALVEDVATDLLDEFSSVPIRKVGVRVSNLSFEAGDQTRLGSWEPSDADASQPNRSPDITRGQVTLAEFQGDPD